jgi:FKBP-type peptidyl-prolyl cis-trans isomerase FkpA
MNAVDQEIDLAFRANFTRILQENDLMIKRLIFTTAFAIALALFFVSCSGSSLSELKTTDVVTGTGAQAIKGASVTVHYTGWLYKDGHRGKKFDSSLDAGHPFAFKLGAGEVIEGWDRGVEGMRVGGKRELLIPSSLGYGESGAPPDIPPNSVLDFEIQLLDVQH